MKGMIQMIHMKYNSKKFYLFLSVLRVLILIILLNHMKIVFSKMAYLYLFIEYMVKMEYIIKNKNAIDPKKEIALIIFFGIILIPLFIKVNFIYNIICYIISLVIIFVL